MTKEDILDVIKNDRWMIGILRAVFDLKLPDWWIGAGFVRSKIWDTVHGYTKRTIIPDIDVIYFDPSDFSKEELERRILEKQWLKKWPRLLQILS